MEHFPLKSASPLSACCPLGHPSPHLSALPLSTDLARLPRQLHPRLRSPAPHPASRHLAPQNDRHSLAKLSNLHALLRRQKPPRKEVGAVPRVGVQPRHPVRERGLGWLLLELNLAKSGRTGELNVYRLSCGCQKEKLTDVELGHRVDERDPPAVAHQLEHYDASLN